MAWKILEFSPRNFLIGFLFSIPKAASMFGSQVSLDRDKH